MRSDNPPVRRLLVFLALVPLFVDCNDSSGGPDASADAGPAAPYTQTLLDNARIGSDPSQPNFQKRPPTSR